MLLAGQRRLVVFSLLLVTCLSASSQSKSTQRAPNPNVVEVFFSPIDKSGAQLTSLTQSDVRIFDNDVAQNISSFERVSQQPVSVVLLVDTSLSQERLAQVGKFTARSFVETFMQSGTDQVTVVGFTGKAKVEQELTSDKDKVVQAVDRLHFETPASVVAGAVIATGPDPKFDESFASAIWDSVWSASESLTLSSTWGTRRIILLLSNGEDTYSRASVRDAIERAQRHNVAIFVIGMGDKNYAGVRQDVLKKIAQETGGRAFFPRKIAELGRIFTQLSDDLRSPYRLRYTRTNRKPPGEFQKLRIQLLNQNSRDAVANYRRAYVSE